MQLKFIDTVKDRKVSFADIPVDSLFVDTNMRLCQKVDDQCFNVLTNYLGRLCAKQCNNENGEVDRLQVKMILPYDKVEFDWGED